MRWTLATLLAAAVVWWVWVIVVACRSSRWIDYEMRSVARLIDDGEPCPCCDAVWHEVDEVVSISGNEVRTRTTLHMDHDDWCRYAEWAGL
jgi:hypothetical protein